MSPTQLKEQIHSQLEKIQDESFLKVVQAMLNTYVQEQEDPVIGYDVEGKPKRASVMKAIYDEQVKAAREKGEYITIEELEKQMGTW
ncbi:MAG: hypothetical protein AAFO07_12930 [Bacteroidota bacterium]